MAKRKAKRKGPLLGEPVPGWKGAKPAPAKRLPGTAVVMEALSLPRHGKALFDLFNCAEEARVWDYIPVGPFASAAHMSRELRVWQAGGKRIFYVICNAQTKKLLGLWSYLRIKPAHGTIEIGFIVFSRYLRKSRAATEAFYLMMRHPFEDLGYRRLEWKCNALNAASCRAAERLGFTFEGIFRSHMVVKGRSRDTAWYSMLASEWPRAAKAFRAWLKNSNFDKSGNQKKLLAIPER
ncbi:MAG TPA: GNAT family protein [Sphingomonadales bacterium]|nr:GNAT family protein [Sphingomonadales bacterium]